MRAGVAFFFEVGAEEPFDEAELAFLALQLERLFDQPVRVCGAIQPSRQTVSV